MIDFILYPEALELKELGFDEPCLKFYANKKLVLALDTDNGDINSKLNQYNPLYVSAPTFSQSFRFFREKHDLQYWMRDGGYLGKCFIKITGYKHDKIYISSSEPMEYEEAELECLRKLIEIAKQKQ